MPEKLQAFQESALAGFAKLPVSKKPLLRFAIPPADVLAAHEVGAIITYPAYTSTSSDENWEWSGGKNGPMSGFIIYGANGRVVEEISRNKREKEVLFAPGARFKVLSRKPRAGKDNVFDFVMAEVNEAGEVIGAIPAPAP